jgi:hypothetical protein
MNTKNQRSNLRSEKDQSASLLIWIISGLYLLVMVWLLLSARGAYGTDDLHPWLASAASGLTIAYCFLMLLLWPNEKAATPKPLRPPANL